MDAFNRRPRCLVVAQGKARQAWRRSLEEQTNTVIQLAEKLQCSVGAAFGETNAGNFEEKGFKVLIIILVKHISENDPSYPVLPTPYAAL